MTVAVWSAVATLVLAQITEMLVGLRVSEDEELEGLDRSAHGESAYRL